jgi:hypothetical protein
MVSGCDQFLLGHWNCVKEGLHRGLSEAPAASMGALFVVVADPQIESLDRGMAHFNAALRTRGQSEVQPDVQ